MCSSDFVTGAVVSEDVGIVVEVRVVDSEDTAVDVVGSLFCRCGDEAVVVVSAVVLSEVEHCRCSKSCGF